MNKVKTVCVLRWGAWGDVLMITPLLRALKDDGWHVTCHVTNRGVNVLRNNPNVDKIIEYINNSIPDDDVEEYRKSIGEKFDKFIDLSGSIEVRLLKIRGCEDYNLPKKDLHEKCNINYYDQTMALGGYPYLKGKSAELFFTGREKKEIAEKVKKIKKYKKVDKLILWSLSGSSVHKAYFYGEEICKKVLDKNLNVGVIFVGDAICEFISLDHERAVRWSGKKNIRKSFILPNYVDLVIGPETGVLNACGGNDVAKILFLSHSSRENLSKYWKNCHSFEPDIFCHPCHKLHYDYNDCHLHNTHVVPSCMVNIDPQEVYNKIIELLK